MKIYSKKDKVWLDYTDTMYPSHAAFYDASQDQGLTFTNEYSTIYGYVFSGQVTLPNSDVVTAGKYFSYWSWGCYEIKYTGKLVLITRIGFKGQNIIGDKLESTGRLCYIDGCSDTLLIYPPRLGDPSLSVLYFPFNTEQTYHVHPSIRLGFVVSGSGYACLKGGKKIKLKTETLFAIEEKESHRFVTEKEPMVVIAFHPDGDWGPTDHNHSMLNRTYIK